MRCEKKNSEQIGIQLKKNSNNHNICAKQATINKDRKKIRLLQEREKEHEWAKRKKSDFQRIDGGEIVRIRNGNKA